MTRSKATVLVTVAATLGFAALSSGCGGDGDGPGATAPQGNAGQGGLPRSAAPPGAAVFIISPQDGATVSSPVNVKFGISGMEVAPAGDARSGTGHHHLIIDAELPNPDQPIPADEQHVHFGKGQTETTVELAPGSHRLQLVLGDGNHVPHQPPIVSKVVTITVE